MPKLGSPSVLSYRLYIRIKAVRRSLLVPEECKSLVRLTIDVTTDLKERIKPEHVLNSKDSRRKHIPIRNQNTHVTEMPKPVH